MRIIRHTIMLFSYFFILIKNLMISTNIYIEVPSNSTAPKEDNES